MVGEPVAGRPAAPGHSDAGRSLRGGRGARVQARAAGPPGHARRDGRREAALRRVPRPGGARRGNGGGVTRGPCHPRPASVCPGRRRAPRPARDAAALRGRAKGALRSGARASAAALARGRRSERPVPQVQEVHGRRRRASSRQAASARWCSGVGPGGRGAATRLMPDAPDGSKCALTARSAMSSSAGLAGRRRLRGAAAALTT